MSAFGNCLEIERKGVEEVVRYLRARKWFTDLCPSPKNEKREKTQRTFGDLCAATPDGRSLWIDFKVEQSHKHGNLFIEEWSNRRQGNPGWLHKIECDWIMYYFYEEKILYCFKKAELCNWAFYTKSRCEPEKLYRILDFPNKPQGKHKQKNDTWGFCVPSKVILEEVRGAKRKTLRAFLEDTATEGPI